MTVPNFCPGCGQKVATVGDAFCRGCGRPLDDPDRTVRQDTPLAGPAMAQPEKPARPSGSRALRRTVGAVVLAAAIVAVVLVWRAVSGPAVEVLLPEGSPDVTIARVADPPPAPEGFTLAGDVYDIEVEDGGDRPAVIRLPIPDPSLADDPNRAVFIGRFNGTEWEMMPAEIVDGMAVASVDHFSRWGVFWWLVPGGAPARAADFQVAPPLLTGIRIFGESAYAELDLTPCRYAYNAGRRSWLVVSRLRVEVSRPSGNRSLPSQRDFATLVLDDQPVVLDMSRLRAAVRLDFDASRPLTLDSATTPAIAYPWLLRVVPIFARDLEGAVSERILIPAGLGDTLARARVNLEARMGGAGSGFGTRADRTPYVILYNRGVSELYNPAITRAESAFALWYLGRYYPYIGMSDNSEWDRVVMHEWGHYAAHMALGDAWMVATPGGGHSGWAPAASRELAFAEDVATFLGQCATGGGLPEASGAMRGQWNDYSRRPAGENNPGALWPNNRNMDAARVECLQATVMARLAVRQGFPEVLGMLTTATPTTILRFFDAWEARHPAGDAALEAAQLIYLEEGLAWPTRLRVVEETEDGPEGLDAVQVRLQGVSGAFLGDASAQTDSDGWFTMALPPGPVQFQLTKPGYVQDGRPQVRADTSRATNAEAATIDDPALPMRKLEVPVVVITSPTPGFETDERVLTVTGTVEGTRDGAPDGEPIGQVTIFAGASEFTAPVQGGSFSGQVLLSPGDVTIRVVARSDLGEGEASVSGRADITATILKLILTWDTNGTDVDIHVTDPEGITTSYQNRTPAEGRELDIDNTSGLGPETYTITRRVPGNYSVRINYYSGEPATGFRVQWILFEGTPQERRGDWSGSLSEADGNGGEPGANRTFSITVP